MLWTKQGLFTEDRLASITSRKIGDLTEKMAAQHLINQGLAFVDSNVHCRQGEIDLVMREGDTYVFIEVKYRKSKDFGGAIAAVSTSKQKKIKHCISHYLQRLSLNEYTTPCRIDVVTIEGNITKPIVTWLKNAF